MTEIYKYLDIGLHVEFDSYGYCAVVFTGIDFYNKNNSPMDFYWFIDFHYE